MLAAGLPKHPVRLGIRLLEEQLLQRRGLRAFVVHFPRTRELLTFPTVGEAAALAHGVGAYAPSPGRSHGGWIIQQTWTTPLAASAESFIHSFIHSYIYIYI